MNIPGFQILRNIFNIPSYDSTNGNLLDAAGTIIPAVPSVTLTQFQAGEFDLTTARHVLVTDVYSDNDGQPSLWYIQPTAATQKRKLVSSHVVYSSLATLNTNFPAASYPGLRALLTGYGAAGIPLVADASLGYISQVSALIASDFEIYKAAAPAAGLTWTVADNGSGKVRATPSAPHTLTSTNSLNAHLQIKTTQNGWTAGDWHEIIDINTTGNGYLDLDVAIGSLGVPVFNLAGDTFTFASVAIPPLLANSTIEIDVSFESKGATATAKNPQVLLDAFSVFAPTWAAAQTMDHPGLITIKNAGATNSQKLSGIVANSSYSGAMGGTIPTGTVDTSAATTIYFKGAPPADDWLRLGRYTVRLMR